MNPLYKHLLAAAALLAVLIALLPSPPTAGRPALVLYCAAGVRAPVEEAIRRYERRHGAAVRVRYGGSNTLLSLIELDDQADAFLAADAAYLSAAQEKRLVDTITPLASVAAVVGVPAKNAPAVDSLDDLLRLRIACGNPDQTAIGRATRDALQRGGRWDALQRRVRDAGVFKPTVGEVANDIAIGSVDAGVVWDAVARQHPGVEAVRIPELAGARGAVAIGVLTSSKNPDAAVRFCRFLAEDHAVQKAFTENGYTPVDRAASATE